MKCLSLATITLLAYVGVQAASEEKVMMDLVTSQNVGQAVGMVIIAETAKRLEFTPDLEVLPPGEHGFRVHMNGSCQSTIKEGKASVAKSAGSHHDPRQTGKYEGPEGVGHVGDPPSLVANSDGNATTPVVTPRLRTIDEVKDKALMIHVDGDNVSD